MIVSKKIKDKIEANRTKLKILAILFKCFIVCSLVGVIAIFYVINHYSKNLPDHEQLKAYNPPIATRLYAKDGRLLKEYAVEKRLFIPIDSIPKVVQNAFLAAEDSRFYEHSGIDFTSLANAMVYNVFAYVRGKKMRGASTITQQVVKNFLLTKDRTIERKIKEAILSFRITQSIPKDKILELYLNQIYLGNRAYGVGAASLAYFDKSLDELTIEESALLASLPKAPGKLNPRKNPVGAKNRRNWVIGRMREDGFITKTQEKTAKETPINLKERDESESVVANYFAEAVRKEIVNMYGEDSLLLGGYNVRTTIDPKLQAITDKYLKRGIESY